MLPLLEAKLEPEMVFEPSLEQDEPRGFSVMVEDLLDDMFGFASLIPRIAAHTGMVDYLP